MAPCTIRWCGKTSHTSSLIKDGITFHKYPTDPEYKKKWLTATKRENWFPSKYSLICSRHFTEDCFFLGKNRRRLLSTAIPTLYLPLLTTEVNPEATIVKSEVPKSFELGISPRQNKFLQEIPSNFASPLRLRRRIKELTDKVSQKNRQLKNLREKLRYMRRRIAFLKFVARSPAKHHAANLKADEQVAKKRKSKKLEVKAIGGEELEAEGMEVEVLEDEELEDEELYDEKHDNKILEDEEIEDKELDDENHEIEILEDEELEDEELEAGKLEVDFLDDEELETDPLCDLNTQHSLISPP